MSLVTFGVISLCIYSSGIIRKDKFAESFVAHTERRLLLIPVRGVTISPVLRENPPQSGLDFLHSAESYLSGSPRGPPFGLSCKITASEITTSNAPWILTVLLEQMELGESCGGNGKSCKINESEQSLWLKSCLFHLHAI